MSRIVVIDDEPFILMMVGDKLKKAGFEVTAVRESVKAMEVIRSQRPDLVIMDWMMPEISGIELCRSIKADPELADNNLPAAIKNWESLYEVDHHGRRTTGHPGGPCFNNPGYRNFTLWLVEDYARSYDIGGIMWGSERQGGLLNTLGLSQSSGQDPGRTTCFCEFCQKKGRDRGIDVERARRGFDEVEAFVRNSRAGERPRDGYFTSFWRLLLNYPEVLAWENLWAGSRYELQAAAHLINH